MTHAMAPLHKRIQLARAVRDAELRRNIAGAQILPDRVTRQPGSTRDLVDAKLVTQRPSPDDTKKTMSITLLPPT